ncbi:hypothetical protein M3Y98_00081500 [Aphelenchoides besseyi]|nr:hypothetical protein M3Y98_00081500 [Aphelenchoides besseyi]KAI6198647.1 hypothetical protein M3Y96_00541400 [Aphelenchoides besseyi]
MRFVLFFLLFSIVSATTSVFKSHTISRVAAKSKSTGPCKSDGTCVNPKDVCEKSTGNCFPEGTPGLDNSENCEDKSAPGRESDCPSRFYLCQDQLYYQLMTDQCPKTCNRCSIG